MSIWREIGNIRDGPSQTAAPERTKYVKEIARHLGGRVTWAGPPRLGGGAYRASFSQSLRANGRPEMSIWRGIGGLVRGPSHAAAAEQTASGYEIAGRLGGFAVRAGAARWGGGT